MYPGSTLPNCSLSKATLGVIMMLLVGVVFLPFTQTALSQIPQQKQILTCDQTGQPSCYGAGYAAGLVNRGIDCTALLSKLSGNSTQIANYCSGNRAAQQALQQQK